MSARVIIHPRCVSGPAAGALAAHLQSEGYDINRIVAGPANKRGRCDLVRIVAETMEDITLERFDGFQFTHRKGGGLAA